MDNVKTACCNGVVTLPREEYRQLITVKARYEALVKLHNDLDTYTFAPILDSMLGKREVAKPESKADE